MIENSLGNDCPFYIRQRPKIQFFFLFCHQVILMILQCSKRASCLVFRRAIIRVRNLHVVPDQQMALAVPSRTTSIPLLPKRLFSSPSSNCPGCGAHFQVNDADKPGYLPKINVPVASDVEIQAIRDSTEPITPAEAKILLRADSPKIIVCKRCHNLKHQGAHEQAPSISTPQSLFKNLKIKGGVVILVVDAMDVPGSLIHSLRDIVPFNRVVVALNKIDLIPKASLEFWKSYIQVKTNAVDIVAISAKSKQLHGVLAWIQKAHETQQDIYLIGCTNVGKSKLMNALLDLSGSKGSITTSNVAGTTMGMIRIPMKNLTPLLSSKVKNEEVGDSYLEESDGYASEESPQAKGNELETEISSRSHPLNLKKSFIYDTPGIFNQSQLNLLLGPKELWHITPPRRISPKLHSLDPFRSYFLGGMVRIESVEHLEISLFTSSRLKVNKCTRVNAERFYADNIGSMLVPPQEMKGSFPALVSRQFKVLDGSVVHISGIGWFECHGKGEMNVFTPDGVGIEIISRKMKIC